MMSVKRRKRIAVVGGGAAGISAALELDRDHDVVLFESTCSLGGHAHSEFLSNFQGQRVRVDTAFLIFNEGTYPCFVSLLDRLGVRDQCHSAEMSSCFSDASRDLHYTLGRGWAPFLARPQNYLRPEFAQIVRDLMRFRAQASADLASGRDLSGITAQEYLSTYSQVFVENFVWPLTAAIWSLPGASMESYPIQSLLNYFNNHQLLRGRSPKLWKTFSGSSAVYVVAFRNAFRGRIFLNAAVEAVIRETDAVRVRMKDGREERFDEVILATHADLSLGLLANPTPEERDLLSAWRYQDNPVTLHHDAALLHPDPRLWGSWNMTHEGERRYRISYYLNRLQNFEYDKPAIITLGDAQIREELVIKRMSYRHPIFEGRSIATQPYLESLNGVDRIHFCGSYFGYGFHEDAVRSGLRAAVSAVALQALTA